MNSKDDVLKIFEFKKFDFNLQKKEAVDKLTNIETPLSKEEVFNILNEWPYTDIIVDLCVNHPSITQHDLEKFVNDNRTKPKIYLECIINSIMERQDGYSAIVPLLQFVDINKLFDKIYKNVGKDISLSQDTILVLADTYMKCDWEVLPQEFSCVFAHIKSCDYIKDKVLYNEDFLSKIENDTKERIFSAIASNINFSDGFRNKVFDMGCNYSMIKSPTNYMKREIYLCAAETFFEIEDNFTDIDLTNTKYGAYKQLEILTKNGLPTECESDLLHRINKLHSLTNDTKKLLNNVFKNTHNPRPLKMIRLFNDPLLEDVAYNNPRMAKYKIRDFGASMIPELCSYVTKHGTNNIINNRYFKKVFAGLNAAEYKQKEYKTLLSCNIPFLDVYIAKSRFTPEPILQEIIETKNSDVLNDIVYTNLAMHKNKLEQHQRTKIFNILDGIRKFERGLIVKETGDTSEYKGPIPANKSELQLYINTINDIKLNPCFSEKEKNDAIYALNICYEIKQKNAKFDIKENTAYHLFKIKENLIKNTENCPNELKVYRNIDKIIDIIQKIDEELKLRNQTQEKGAFYYLKTESETERG